MKYLRMACYVLASLTTCAILVTDGWKGEQEMYIAAAMVVAAYGFILLLIELIPRCK